jgi:GAF domain-containing protein
MKNREQLLQRLLYLSEQLAATLDRQEIEETSTTVLSEAFEADCCAVLHLGPEQGQGHISVARPTKELDGVGLSKESCRALQPLLSEDNLQIVQGTADTHLEPFLQRLQVASAVLYPLRTKDPFPPLLCLGFAAEEAPLTTDDLALLETAGRLVSSTLANALRQQRTLHQLQELGLLHDIAMAISSTLDLDEILHRVVDAIFTGLTPDCCVFLFVDDPEGILRGHASSQGIPGPPEEITIPLGQGVTGWAAQTGQALLIPDVTRDPRYIPVGIEGVRAEICVPIQVGVGGQVVAVLNLESRSPNAFNREHLRLVSTVAGQLSVAIERDQIFRQSRERVRELAALMQVSTSMQRATRLEEILEVYLEEAFNLVGYEQGFVMLLGNEGNALRIAASRGLPETLVEELNQQRIPPTLGTFATVLQTGTVLEIPDTSSDPLVESGYGPVPPQMTCLPLKTTKSVIGVLVLDAIPANDASRNLLQAMGDMASAAIERARMFEETRQRLDEVRLLQEVAMAATSTLDFDEVLRRSVRALQRRLAFEGFALMVVDERTGLLHLHPTFPQESTEVPEFTTRIGEGITGWVAQTGEPYFSGDVRNDPHYIDVLPGILSELCVPVKVGNQVIAVINLESARPNAFGQNEVDLLTAMAHQLAIALQNARLYERAQEQRRLAEAMRQAAVVLGATLDSEDLLDQSLAYLERLLPFDAAFLVLLRGTQVERAHSRGAPLPPEEKWLGPGTLGGRVHTEHRAIVLADVRQERSWQPLAGTEGLLSWVGVPILTKEEICGMLLVGTEKANSYGREEATIAFSFAGQLALVIERVRAYEQEHWRMEQLDLLHHIGRRVIGIVELEPLIEETVSCIHEILRPYQTTVAILEDERLAIQAASGQEEMSISKKRIPLDGPGVVSWVARKGVPTLVSDVEADSRFQASPHLPDARAEMAVPLRAKGEVIGVLDIQGDRVGQFNEGDLSTLQAVGIQVAGTIERTLLYTDLQESVKRLQETDRLRSDFLSTINHEIRAPLTAILGFTDFLLREQAGSLTSAQEEYLGDIRAGGERILMLVDNLLEAARLEEGRVIPRCTRIHLRETASRTMAMVQPTAMEKALTLTSRVPADLPSVWADRMMVERILINLLSNAVKFTPPGGSVWIEAQVSPSEPALVEISVCDTGIGIAPEHYEEIFRRYRRLETPAVGQTGGTGLGLYIVKGLVETLGGQIRVESTVGRGSFFTFTLPAAQ